MAPAAPEAQDRPTTLCLPLTRGRTARLPRPAVMAILNATPDSFSDGGALPVHDRDALAQEVRRLLAAGADILDVGGESTRPGHGDVSVDEEIRRVVPVLEVIRAVAPDAVVSIDTRKAKVARAALEAGADLVNDVSGLDDLAMAAVLRDAGCAAILMRHGDCTPPVLEAASVELETIRDKAIAAGIEAAAIILDPGLGFGARPGPHVADNLELVDGVDALERRLGHPVLVGASRKRFIGTMTHDPDPLGVARRDGSVQVALQAARRGAAILRVHDVAETVAALQAAWLRRA